MLLLTERFPRKRAFITGAGSGLGRAFARLLAAEGWTLGLTDINPDTLDDIVRELTPQCPAVHAYHFDVSDKHAFEGVSISFLTHAGGLDLLINNAGVGDGGPFVSYSLDNWAWMIGVNLMGVVHGCHFFVPELQKQKSGHVINIASAAGLVNGPNMAPYNSTKAGVISLSETLLYELAPYQVGVTVLMPTFFKTNIMQYARGPKDFHRFAERQMEKSPLDAPQVAHQTLEAAGKGVFDLILPGEAHKQHRFKRWFPKRYRKKMTQASLAIHARLAQKRKQTI